MFIATAKRTACLHVLILLTALPVLASDATNNIADALTDSAIAFLAQGKKSKAEDFLLRALANDEKNIRAMFELAKLDNLGEVAGRAYTLSDEKSRRTMLPQIDRLFPVSAKILHAMEDYDTELIRMMKLAREKMTVKECQRRLQFIHEPVELNLPFDPVGSYYSIWNEKKPAIAYFEIRENGVFGVFNGSNPTWHGKWVYDDNLKVLTTTYCAEFESREKIWKYRRESNNFRLMGTGSVKTKASVVLEKKED